MSNSKKLFTIGLMVFISIIIFIGGIFFLQDLSLKGSNYSFNVIFQNVQGLYEGDDVKMLGKKIGKVTNTKIIDNKIQAELSIDNSFAFKIPIDSKIEVKSEGFLGTKYISIDPGPNNDKFIAVGETVLGTREYDFSEITPEILPITQDIAVFARKLKALLGEEEKDRIRSIIENLESLTNNIDEFSKVNSNIISEDDRNNLKELINNLNEASTTFKSQLNNDIANILDNISEGAPDLKEAIKNLNNITQSFDSTSKNINQIIENIEKKNNTLGKLIYEDSLYTNINGVALDLRALIQDVKDNPTKYMKAYFQGKK